MNDTIIVNGKTLSWLFVQRGFKIPSFNFEIQTEKVEGRVGSVFKRRHLAEHHFEIPLVIHNDKLSGMKSHDEILHELTKFFDYDEAVKLQFKSKNWYWNAYFEGPFEVHNKSENNINVVNVKVILTDPYKYAVKGNKNTAISDSVSVVNLGTAPTPITVEARALKDSTNFMITKGDKDYFMLGKSEDANKVNKDIAPFMFNDEFNNGTLRNWAYMPDDTSFGRFLDGGDAMGGRFVFGDESMFPNIWGAGTKTGWHGPGIYKTLNKSVQDFRIRFKLSVHQGKGIGTGKSVAYLVDENNRLQFSVVYVNTSATINNTQIVVYAYDEHGSVRKIYTRDVPQFYRKLKNIHVYMFLERKGQNLKVTSYFYDVLADNRRGYNIPVGKDERIIVDRGNLYQRKVRICRIYRGKSTKYEKYLWHSILGFYIQELLPKQSDITPIEIRRGDNIVIDTLRKTVSINDEDALHLKDFGSNYFEIDKGTSELVVYPPNTFDTTVKWQDRYL
ncbi:distal tail protein Dit [Staphylococcus rostri]